LKNTLRASERAGSLIKISSREAHEPFGLRMAFLKEVPDRI